MAGSRSLDFTAPGSGFTAERRHGAGIETSGTEVGRKRETTAARKRASGKHATESTHTTSWQRKGAGTGSRTATPPLPATSAGRGAAGDAAAQRRCGAERWRGSRTGLATGNRGDGGRGGEVDAAGPELGKTGGARRAGQSLACTGGRGCGELAGEEEPEGKGRRSGGEDEEQGEGRKEALAARGRSSVTDAVGAGSTGSAGEHGETGGERPGDGVEPEEKRGPAGAEDAWVRGRGARWRGRKGVAGKGGRRREARSGAGRPGGGAASRRSKGSRGRSTTGKLGQGEARVEDWEEKGR